MAGRLGFLSRRYASNLFSVKVLIPASADRLWKFQNLKFTPRKHPLPIPKETAAFGSELTDHMLEVRHNEDCASHR